MNLDLHLLLRTAGVAIGLVFLLLVAVRGGWRRHGDLLAVLACAVAYLVCSAPSLPSRISPVALPLLLGAIAFPFAFWRFARVVLQDDRRIPAAAWAGLAVLVAGGLLASRVLDAPPAVRSGAVVLNKLAAFAFVLGALYALGRSWAGDLVEPRRRLRRALVAYLGGYGLVVLSSEVYLQGSLPPAWLDLLNAALIGASLLVALVYFVQPRPELLEALFGAEASPPPAPPEPEPKPEPPRRADNAAADEALQRRLADCMEAQHAYRDPDLSVATLATRVGVPEYVLRRVIHERLGHRNFAAYVNEYRLREVEVRLRDPQWARRPILTLALEAGFGSIGPFNRAFRDRHGVTPSEYRLGAGGAAEASEAGPVEPASS